MLHMFYEVSWYIGAKLGLFLMWVGRLFDKLILILWTLYFVGGVCFFSGMRRARMSHNNGALGRGKLKFVEDGQWPEAEFFVPGDEHPVRVRHAAAAYMDDAMKLVRSMSIKCADTTFKSPWDLEMNTGRITFFWTAYQFMQFAFNRDDKDGIEYITYYAQNNRGRCGARAGFRRNSPSFMAMYYQSQCPVEFIAKDGKTRYVKFRSIPLDRSEEGGLIPDEPQETAEQIGNQQMLEADSDKGRDWQKDAWKEQIEKGEAKYMLQMQLHEWTDQSMPEFVFNSNVEWDEETHPWMDLAEIDVTELMGWEEQWWTSYALTNHPESIKMIPAKSIHDYNSINFMRARTWPARYVRLFFGKLLGVPKPLPDERPPYNAVCPGG